MAEEVDAELPLQEEVVRRLDLITNTPGAVLKYDTDGDGVLDEQEWEVLRSIVEAEVVREREGGHEEEETWTIQEEVDDPHVDLPVMEVIDRRYEVLREIGRGAQGKTLLARRRADGHYVAVKELIFAELENWKSLELFEREAEVLGRLDHPHIPSFVDSFSVDIDDSLTRFFLVQSFVSGSSLDVLLARRERISERQVLDFAKQVLGMLDYLHRQDPPIIHRDVKPSNLIKQPDGNYSLVDFGGAQVMVPSDVGGSTIIGTTGYMPPEQLTGRACPQSDLYGLGATLVHLVTHISPSDLPTRRLKLDWRDRANLTRPMSDFIDRLIEPVVEDRFASAREAQQEVEMFLGGSAELIKYSTSASGRSAADVARRKERFFAERRTSSSGGRGSSRAFVVGSALVFAGTLVFAFSQIPLLGLVLAAFGASTLLWVVIRGGLR